eukprot:TRINITY_DN60277_c0_g1_i1.p1 TRINITY_DN60277_c0_g1~~TRINITY_DN60277_c0_g1_i1.p1  ORF type:complete len:309 (+),score=79.25 TRINITY_DN60277_c0_g1_i1:158-1084(+)
MATLHQAQLIRCFTCSLGDIAAQHIKRCRQRKGDLPPGRPGVHEQHLFFCPVPDALGAVGGDAAAAEPEGDGTKGGEATKESETAREGEAAKEPAQVPSPVSSTPQGPAEASGPCCVTHPCDDFSALRTVRMGLVGLLYVGPVDFFWYHLQARMFPGTDTITVVKKLLIDQLIFSPLTNSAYLCVTQGLRTASCADIRRRWQDGFCVVQGINYCVYTPTLFISYMYVPVDWQVAVMGVVGFGFTVFEATVANRPMEQQPPDRSAGSPEDAEESGAPTPPKVPPDGMPTESGGDQRPRAGCSLSSCAVM